MTPEEEAAWEADRKTQKEFDIANAAERDRRIEGTFGDFSLKTTLVWRSETAFGRSWPPHRPLSVTAVTRPSADPSPKGARLTGSHLRDVRLGHRSSCVFITSPPRGEVGRRPGEGVRAVVFSE